jgi:hypothetical protein
MRIAWLPPISAGLFLVDYSLAKTTTRRETSPNAGTMIAGRTTRFGRNGPGGPNVPLARYIEEEQVVTHWSVSAALEVQLASRLASFERDYGAIGYPVYPSVMWSLGGEAYRPDNRADTRIVLPAEYATGFYRTDPLPTGDRLLFVPSVRFGIVVFLPNDEDTKSDRRLIDYDGKDIRVR